MEIIAGTNMGHQCLTKIRYCRVQTVRDRARFSFYILPQNDIGLLGLLWQGAQAAYLATKSVPYPGPLSYVSALRIYSLHIFHYSVKKQEFALS